MICEVIILEKSCFRIFFSKSKENKWLNEMGNQGCLLQNIHHFKYYFAYSEENVYSYSIEYLDCPSQSNKASNYINSRCCDGVTCVCVKNDWAYFVSADNAICPDHNILKKNRIVYFWRSLYLFFFSFITSLITGYQIYAASFLNNIGEKNIIFFALFIPSATILLIILSVLFGINFTEYLNFKKKRKGL